MRRILVSLTLLFAATASAWVVATPGAAAGAARSPRIACPQQRPDVIPCCPVPPGAPAGAADVQPACCPVSSPTCCTTSCCTTSCCTGTPCCPMTTPCCTSGSTTACCIPAPCPPGAALTIGSSPDPSTAGRPVVISGVLSATPAGGVQVALWRERAGQSSFQQVAQATTDSTGAYKFTLGRGVVLADQAWYVTSGALRSATIDQQVRALVGLVPSQRSMRAGQQVLLKGHVTPAHPGESVLIEQSHGGGWRVIARARLSKGSNYTFSHRFTQIGRTEVRAVLRADARNVQSVSPVLTLTVSS